MLRTGTTAPVRQEKSTAARWVEDVNAVRQLGFGGRGKEVSDTVAVMK